MEDALLDNVECNNCDGSPSPPSDCGGHSSLIQLYTQKWTIFLCPHINKSLPNTLSKRYIDKYAKLLSVTHDTYHLLFSHLKELTNTYQLVWD